METYRDWASRQTREDKDRRMAARTRAFAKAAAARGMIHPAAERRS